MMRRLVVPVSLLAAAFTWQGLAQADPLQIFQPTHVRAISVTPADVRALRGLPPLEAFGTLRGTRSPGVEELASAQDAAQQTGYALRLPKALPSAIPNDARYEVTQRAHTTFTFSAAKAAAWAKQQHVALRPLPPRLDGATYTATLAPVAIVTYGTPPRNRHAERGVRRGNFLAVVQAPLPAIGTNGPPLSVLRDWFTQQPGIPRDLAAQVRAIGDPAQTLPIPVRFDKQTATTVHVDGVDGLAIGDETGIGAAVVWTKAGKLYAVGGTLTQSAALAIANDLTP